MIVGQWVLYPTTYSISIEKTTTFFTLDEQIFKFMLGDPTNSAVLVRAVGSSGFVIRDEFSNKKSCYVLSMDPDSRDSTTFIDWTSELNVVDYNFFFSDVTGVPDYEDDSAPTTWNIQDVDLTVMVSDFRYDTLYADFGI